MSDLQYRSDFEVTYQGGCGSDREIAHAAWAEKLGDTNPTRDNDAGYRRVIASCMKGRHNSPFEQGLMKVFVDAPGVAWWQLTRHRFMSLDSEDFSPNLESGRYKHLRPLFYIPPPERPTEEPAGFKPMRPVLGGGGDEWFNRNLRVACSRAWDAYQGAILNGVAREVAHLFLPNWSLYCAGVVSARPLTWLQFFSKRHATPATTVATFPQWEIERVAAQCEALFADRWPITYSEFLSNGRVAP